jgi:hypothetical protein
MTHEKIQADPPPLIKLASDWHNNKLSEKDRSEFVEDVTFHAKQPKWKHWRQFDRVTLKQAVELSCGLDPELLGTLILFGHELISTVLGPLWIEKHNRLTIARSHLGTSLKFGPSWNSDEDNRTVRLSEFAAWATSMKWRPLPRQFKAIAKTKPPPSRYAEFDPASDKYPPELDKAMQAWRYAVKNAAKRKPPKQLARDFLEQNYPDMPNDAKDRIATVANWDKKGGAPRRGSGSKRKRLG